MDDTDRPVLSREAIDALRTELDDLKTEGRRKISERLRTARELGDISDNAAFESAKHDQGMLEGRVIELEQVLRHAVERQSPTDASVVTPGLLVTVRDSNDPDFEDSFVVAESAERASGARVLSPKSPLGQALLGKRVGDTVTYDAPGGTFTYEVVSLEPA